MVSGAAGKYRPLHPLFMAQQATNNPQIRNLWSKGSTWGFMWARLAGEKLELQEALTGKDEELEASLQEEERLASELEAAHEAMTGLRRSADALKGERDTLARQVSDLTKERAELLEARKALEAVHRALAKASAVA
jgi:chromosome segregation ATPase